VKIRFEGVCKSFGAQAVLRDVSLEVEFDHTLALVGPSGGGKSTLLRLIAGLEAADAGQIFLNGVALPADGEGLRRHRARTGIVFQAFNLFPHLDALENVVLPLVHVHGVPRKEALGRAEAVLRRFRLGDHSHKQPAQLSGGQRQRVAIARALATDPEFLLLDEPTSALDPEMTSEVLDVISELRDSGKPLVLVTHEMGFARQSADLVAFIADGGIAECPPAAEFFASPSTPAARAFLSKVLKY
jgi:polar amino acid transport system ATP-binding protein